MMTLNHPAHGGTKNYTYNGPPWGPQKFGETAPETYCWQTGLNPPAHPPSRQLKPNMKIIFILWTYELLKKRSLGNDDGGGMLYHWMSRKIESRRISEPPTRPHTLVVLARAR